MAVRAEHHHALIRSPHRIVAGTVACALTVMTAACGVIHAPDVAQASAASRPAPPTQSVALTPQIPDGITDCRIDGWANDSDPAGLNVRAAPDRAAKILGTLPAYLPDGKAGHAFGVPVDITASNGGWLRISGARDDPERSGQPARQTYAGDGWVAADRIAFKVQSGRGRSAPDARAAAVIDLGGDTLDELGSVRSVLACKDDWALVEFTVTAQRDARTDALREVPAVQQRPRRAWFQRICGNQETTCDMPDEK